MALILVSDIFGKTPALLMLAKELNAESIIDPYNGVDMSFNNESDAYTYFTETIGFEAYVAHLRDVIKAFSTAKTLIGFSIGASAIWRLSETVSTKHVNNAICYYGSQIRNYTEIVPQFDIDMAFPKHETHFDVLALQTELATKAKVKVVKTDYLHGFMNQLSSNYHPIAYQEHTKRLCLSSS